MVFRASLLTGLLLGGGCYMNLGGGSGLEGGAGPTVHMTLGIAVPIGHRGHIHGGVSTAGSFGRTDATPTIGSGPVALGAAVHVVGTAHHALGVVGDVTFPTGGNWLAPDEKSQSIGRAYAGVGYTYISWSTDHDESGNGFERPDLDVTVTAGPELFWADDGRRFGLAVDLSLALHPWVIRKTLDEK